MRELRVCLFVMMLAASTSALGPYQHPIARGTERRQWAQPPNQVSSCESRTRPNSRVLASDAAELARLAQSAATDIDMAANRGVISKDLHDKLKRIEKLARKLRSEMQP